MQDLVSHNLRPHLQLEGDQTDMREPLLPDLSILEQQEDSGLDFRKYWFIARKHLLMILILFVLTFAFFAFRTFTETPLYTAQNILLVKQSVPDILNKPEADSLPDEGYSDNYYKTQNSILQSRTLAAMVIKELDLAQDKAFLGGQQNSPPLQRLVE